LNVDVYTIESTRPYFVLPEEEEEIDVQMFKINNEKLQERCYRSENRAMPLYMLIRIEFYNSTIMMV